MSRFERLQVYQTIIEDGMIPLFFSGDKEKASATALAVYSGGSRLLEFTNRGDKALEVFDYLINCSIKDFPSFAIGAGTITDAYTAALFIEHGADFIVGPNFDEATARLCNRKRIPYIPGAATVNEIIRAEEFGAEIIKIFPGSTLGGPKFVEAVLGPCSKTKIMPTGGVSVDEENIKAWFRAGVCCIGMGSQLISKKDIEEGAYDTITEKTKKVLELIKSLRAKNI